MGTSAKTDRENWTSTELTSKYQTCYEWRLDKNRFFDWLWLRPVLLKIIILPGGWYFVSECRPYDSENSPFDLNYLVSFSS